MDFSRLSEFIRTAPERWKIPSLDCSVYVCHREVFRERSGFSDTALTRPASDRDLYFIHSSSKVALAVASMQLVEQGLISLQDPVSEYLPEFGAAGVQDGLCRVEEGICQAVPAVDLRDGKGTGADHLSILE